MRRLTAFLLAVAMIFSIATTAAAASITITPPDVNGGTESGITYTVYKIFDAVFSEDGEHVAYTIESTSPYFAAIQAASELFTLEKAPDSETTYYVTKTDAYTEEVANTFAETLKAIAATAAGTLIRQGDGTYRLDDLEDGYYLVTSSVGSALILDTIGDISIQTKNEYPSLDKKVHGRDDYITADMGRVLTFSIDVDIPENASGEIIVHDQMTGLEFVEAYTFLCGDHPVDHPDSLPAVGDKLDTEYIPSTLEDRYLNRNPEDGCDVHFVLPEDYVEQHLGHTISIEYTAKLTDHVGINDAWLENNGYTSKPDEVKAFCADLVIDKYDGNDGTKLKGAKFILFRVDEEIFQDVKSLKTSNLVEQELEEGIIVPPAEGRYGNREIIYTYYRYDPTTKTVSWTKDRSQATVFTTDEQGRAVFIGLSEFCGNKYDGYFLEEIEAPPGYNMLTYPAFAQFQINTQTGANGETVVLNNTVSIGNKAGTELPSTGGTGTTLFYIFGAILMVGAAVLMVTKRRMNMAE